jgi:hypothetical protein
VDAASPWWNKVLLALFHLVVAFFGAGDGPVRSGLSRSGDQVGAPDPVGSGLGVFPAVPRCLGTASRSLVFCFVGTVAVVGSLEDWWLDRAHASRGGSRRRRRAPVQDPGSSGCVPGRWAFSDGYISPYGTSVFCGFFQSLCAMELPRIWMAAATAGAGDHRRWKPSVGKGSRDLFVISVFLVALSAMFGGIAGLYPYTAYLYLYLYWSVYVSLTYFNTGTFCQKKTLQSIDEN